MLDAAQPEQYLVNDATAGMPEAHAVLGGRAAEEVVHLLVVGLGMLQVCNATKLAPPAAQCC